MGFVRADLRARRSFWLQPAGRNEETLNYRLRGWRAAGYEDVDRQNSRRRTFRRVRAGKDPAADGAGADRDDESGFRHRLVGETGGLDQVPGHHASDEKKVSVARRGD